MKVNYLTSTLCFLAFCLVVSEVFPQGGNVRPPPPVAKFGGEGNVRPPLPGMRGGGVTQPPGSFQPGMVLPMMGQPPGMQPAVVTPRPKRKPPAGEMVLTGRRVRDAITKKLLDDVYYDHVPQSELSQLNPAAKDDGIWPDLMADDGIYSNFEVIDDQYISFESNELKKTLIKMLIAAETLSPQKFFLISVTAADPYSSLPFNIDKEEERDRKIEEFNLRWLSEWRQNPQNPMSSFLPLYVPRPPDFPYSDPPAGFVYIRPGDVVEDPTGLAGPPGALPGGMRGAAQTQYFTAPGQRGPGGAGMLGLGRARGVAGEMNRRAGAPPGRGGGRGGGGGG